MRLCVFLSLFLVLAGCSGGSDGDDCSGCLIGSICYPDQVTNPDNPCQICDPAASTSYWNNNDGASCDDGLFCTGADTCSGETCQSTGDPCDFPYVCWEDGGGRCCTPDDRIACNADGDAASYDSCGHELSVVDDCADVNGTCQDGVCGCLPGLSGENCDICDLIANAGCQPTEKCTFIVESTDPLVGQAGCAADGTVDEGDACTFSGSPGIDDCKAGLLCTGGICKSICNVSPNSCTGGGTCVHDQDIFEDTGVGLCEPGCDLYGQDCTNGETCYLLLGPDNYPTVCSPAVPEPDVAHDGCVDVELTRPQLQGECCSYINTCDTGYGCTQPNPYGDGRACARFCDPTGTLGTDDCSSVLGSEFFCLSITNFYSDASGLDPAYGFCLDAADWGPPECWNKQQDADEHGVDCCNDPPGTCPCKFPCP